MQTTGWNERKATLFNLIKTGLSHLPERVKMIVKEQDLVIPLDYPGLHIVANSAMEYYVRSRPIEKEPETVAWIKQMSPRSVFYDVGANIGAYSLIAARHHPGLRVYAFEPAGPNYSSLIKNVMLNGESLFIVGFPFALAARTEMTFMFHSSFVSGAALHVVGQGAQSYEDYCSIAAVRLDDLIRIFELPLPTHLKIDVDGTEIAVLEGALETLGSTKSIMIEIADRNREKALWLLAKYGFREHVVVQVGERIFNYQMERITK